MMKKVKKEIIVLDFSKLFLNIYTLVVQDLYILF